MARKAKRSRIVRKSPKIALRGKAARKVKRAAAKRTLASVVSFS